MNEFSEMCLSKISIVLECTNERIMIFPSKNGDDFYYFAWLCHDNRHISDIKINVYLCSIRFNSASGSLQLFHSFHRVFSLLGNHAAR